MKKKFTKSKSFCNFKRRELSQTEKSLLDKYKNDKKHKSNLKLKFNDEKIKNLYIKDNYYNSIIINKKGKEYYKNLYNNENIDLNNTQINNNKISNYPKNILSKTKKILETNSNNFSYNNIYDKNRNNDIPNLLYDIDNKNYENNSKLNIKSLCAINTFNNNKYNFKKIYQKKISAKKIKNKIVFDAVNVLRKKRNENKPTINEYNNFKYNNTYNKLKLERNVNNNSWLQYSSIMTDLINKNKKKIF